MNGRGASLRGGAANGARTIPIAADALESWADNAEPGQRITYASGPAELPEHPTFVLAGSLRRQGAVITHIKRRDDGGGFDFLAVRRARDVAEQVRNTATVDDDDLDQIVLRELRRCASLQWACPTNAELARRCGLKDALQASYRMRKLIEAGHILVEGRGPMQRRIVTIVATGKQTVPGAL